MTADCLMDLAFPARDQSLARVIGDLSEPDVGRPADNLMTNEDSVGRVAAEIARLAPAGGVYLGVGPDQNFTLMAHARPGLAVVLDFRRRNALLHLMHKALFMLSHDRASYLGRLIARRSDNGSGSDLVSAFGHRPMDRSLLDRTTAEVASLLGALGLVGESELLDLATIEAKLAGPGLEARFLAMAMYPTLGRLIGQPGHFLARDDWFQAVRSLQLGDRVIPLTGDFAGTRAMPALAGWLRTRGLAVSVVYVSDVEFFLLRSGKFSAYVNNLAALPWLEGAQLVRTSTREIHHPDRFPGDSSTTIVRPVARFLEAAKAGRIKTVDDLFDR